MYLAPALAQNPENRVFFLSRSIGSQVKMPHVQLVMYKWDREVSEEGGHAYLKPAEEAVLEGQAVVRALHSLKQRGFVPDVVIGHTGWGSLTYVKDYYPDVPVIGYFEWYYHALHADGCWWPEEKADIDMKLRVRTRNAHHLLALEACDVGVVPTQWQYDQFPKEFQYKLSIMHDGVDTNFCQPKAGVRVELKEPKLTLPADAEVLTYVSRGFESYRGFPQFMEAVRILLQRRPKLHVLLIGQDKVCYGPKLKDMTYQEAEEKKGGYDKDRVHFLGLRNRGDYRMVLQASHVHVYLTRPFVLSWSMLEAMSFGCPMVVSQTPPVEEVVQDGVNGLLAEFRSPHHIADRVEELLNDRELAKRLGEAGRQTVVERYSVEKCLRRQVNFIYGHLMKSGAERK